jgi:hypothetical protein
MSCLRPDPDLQPCFCKCKYSTVFEPVDDGAWGSRRCTKTWTSRRRRTCCGGWTWTTRRSTPHTTSGTRSGSHNLSKMTFEVGKNSWEEAGVYSVQQECRNFVCVCGKERIHERWHANCMPIQRHLWSCGENCISALRACCSFEAAGLA